MYGLPRERVHELLQQERKKEADPLWADPTAFVTDYVFRLDAVIEELVSIASKEKKGANRIRAVEARFKALHERARIQEAAIGLPRGLASIRSEQEFDHLIDRLLDVLQERDLLDEGLIDAIAEATTDSPPELESS
jgi:hypothetical protein